MVDLTTTYLGMKLRSPIVASASPLSERVENFKRLEDAGAGAVVMYSLFEEQIRREREMVNHYLSFGTDSFSEAQSFFPEPEQTHVGTEYYLDLIRQAKASVKIPIIASLNGTTLGGWTLFATKMQEAGADALELNIYDIPTNMYMTGDAVENIYVEILETVKQAVTIPVALKLSPYFSNFAYMAHRFDQAGANALVMFNRFYQPDIDIETREVVPNVQLSNPQAQRLPMTWIGILYGRIKADMAATSGVHSGTDVVKMLMAGATVTMMTSALLRNGIDHVRVVEQELVDWMASHEYESVAQMRGSVSQMHAEDPTAFERAQYMKALKTFHL